MVTKNVRTPNNDLTKSNGYGIAGLSLSVLSLLIPGLGFILAILGIIFSQMQRNRSPNDIATAGLVVGIVSLVFQVLIVLAILSVLLWIVPVAVVSG